ncbi:Pimeloyl-ACP methyl ester carboxylesterase [Pasteurella testudinis DSM 23072]|uniref:Pimeloyl-ACP methyl ester carboxylesterase n=1 Tax=Pasteurella testudinis DSM 23072 TaxID=1122938 RepID=A0A1W1V6P5_9PAST|nr:alpha/beta hydrolase [Pasteurella testudinis]SMB89119.1 Pimeloyl-ACP methyl ester carboxylesterase [Pasteurella testudinis DSM 23072]SUB50196.1 putative esterase/lipase [Pasteurella testudinis]
MNKIFALLTALLAVGTLHAADIQPDVVKPNQVLRYFGQQPNGYVSQIPYGNNSRTGHYVQSGDAKIYYEVYGKGEPIVLLHGGVVGSMAEMGEFADKLKATRQVVLVNTRGHGKSDIGSAAPSYRQKAQDLQAVLSALKIAKTDIIGFSDGAYTGYQFAADYPQAVGKLVAIGAGEWKQGFVQGGQKDRNAPFTAIEALDPNYWQQQAAIRPQTEQTATWFKQANRQYDQTVVGKELFVKIHAPVLVLAGEDDANAPLDSVIAAYKMLPNADLAIIPNAPHPVAQINFAAVWTLVEPFLNQ